jgi:voltage-gated potassium channel Kch
MFAKLLFGWALMAVCVAIHAVGLTLAIRWFGRGHARMERKFLAATWMLIRVAGWVLILHLLEISLWALFYQWKDCLPDLDSAFYFSAVTYTTTGYGDIVLPQPWRMVGAVEALTGILMCGWSTAFFFAVVSRRNPTPSDQPGAVKIPQQP